MSEKDLKCCICTADSDSYNTALDLDNLLSVFYTLGRKVDWKGYNWFSCDEFYFQQYQLILNQNLFIKTKTIPIREKFPSCLTSFIRRLVSISDVK